MIPTHFRNASGHVVKANDWLIEDWKNLDLEPIYKTEKKPSLEEVEEYKAFTVTELRAKCKAAGVTGYSKMNEAELIEALLEA